MVISKEFFIEVSILEFGGWLGWVGGFFSVVVFLLLFFCCCFSFLFLCVFGFLSWWFLWSYR